MTKKLVRHASVLAIALVTLSKIDAQVAVTYGPEIGGAATRIYDDVSLYAGITGHIGAVAHVQVGKFFAVRPATFFKTGTMTSDENSASKISLDRIGVNLPLLFSYNFKNKNKVFVGGGPSIKYSLSGKIKHWNSDEVKIGFGNSNNDFMKPIDVGLHLTAGFQFNRGLAIGLFFQKSFSDTYNTSRGISGDAWGKLRTMDVLGASVGWMFGGGKK